MTEPTNEAIKNFVEEARAAGNPNIDPAIEEFFAEGTTPLADTTPLAKSTMDVGLERLYVQALSESTTKFMEQHFAPVVDGDRTQLTETQMGAVVEEVLDQTISGGDPQGFKISFPLGSPSLVDQAIVDSKLSAVYFRIETLEEQNKKIIAALKHLGLDTNKHFR